MQFNREDRPGGFSEATKPPGTAPVMAPRFHILTTLMRVS